MGVTKTVGLAVGAHSLMVVALTSIAACQPQRRLLGQIPLAGHQCWLPNGESLSAADVHLVVRTANVKQGWRHFGRRLSGIAREFRDDWGLQAGVIGLQEQRKSSGVDCLLSTSEPNHGAACLAEELGVLFRHGQVQSSHHKSLGFVVGSPWRIVSTEKKTLGRDKRSHGPNRSTRRALEVVLDHEAQDDWRLRVYTLHLSHGDQASQRKSQLEKFSEWVQSRVESDELPSLVIGDFNEFPVQSCRFKRLFRQILPPDQCSARAGIDQIWVLRGTEERAFGLRVIRYHVRNSPRGVNLTAERDLTLRGGVRYSGGLSDHDSPAVTFKIVPRVECTGVFCGDTRLIGPTPICVD